MNRAIKRFSLHPFIIRLFHWEYWPFDVVYAPMYLVYLWFGVRARSFFFFAAANPTIKNGGFLMETKSAIDPLIPEPYKPTTIYFENGTDFSIVLKAVKEKKITFPCIVKPDNGSRGRGVRKVYNEQELKEVLAIYPVPYVIQNFIPYPKELGIFYVRLPNEPNGKILSIVGKEFVQVTGDGKHTIYELLQQNGRYVLQLPVLKKLIADRLEIILPAGEKEILLPYGSHSRGCLFVDDSHKIDGRLTKVMDNICTKINGFYYGRLDIRYNTWEELVEGKNFCIIEINGAGSDPTHMYDPKHSIFFAWKEIIRHWKMMYKISVLNRKNGHPYLTVKEGLQMFKDNAAYDKTLNAFLV